MTTERETTSAVRDWLRDGDFPLPDRVLDLALDEVATVRQRRSRWTPEWLRLPSGLGAVAAVVLLMALLSATFLAGRFVGAEDASLRLAGQGVRDTSRIAASAPELWVQILGANADPVVEVLDALAADLSGVARALRDPDAPGARRAVADTIRRGNEGVERLPGKHGQNRRFETVVVMVDDTPGQLGRLFGDLGELGVNVEDFRLEHSPGAQFGLGEISVVPSAVIIATDGLAARGWKIASLND